MRGADGLETVTLGLDTPVLSQHVHHGRINVNCTASVANAYWESRIESASVHVAQKLAVLESTEMRSGATGEGERVTFSCHIHNFVKYTFFNDQGIPCRTQGRL